MSLHPGQTGTQQVPSVSADSLTDSVSEGSSL